MRQNSSRRLVGSVFACVASVVIAGATGCQPQGRSTKVPGAAMPVGQAQAQPLTWMADRTGTLYVVDVPADTVVYRGPIRTGQTLVVDPQVNRISIDGRMVSEGKLKSRNRNDVYLHSGAVRTEKPSDANRVGGTGATQTP